MDQNYQYYSDDEEFFDARSHATNRSDASYASFMTAKQGSASIVSKTRSRLNEVAVLSELEAFEDTTTAVVKDETATPPLKNHVLLPPTPHPPFLNHLYESEEQGKETEEDEAAVEDQNPLFETIDLPLPPPPSSWNKATISPTGSDHQKTTLRSDVNAELDQAHIYIAMNMNPPAASPPERRAFRTISGLVNKMAAGQMDTSARSGSEIKTPQRLKIEATAMSSAEEAAATDSPQVVVPQVESTPVLARDDQNLMQAAKGSTGRIARLKSPSPAVALTFSSPQPLNKPRPLILPSAAGLKSPSPSPSTLNHSPVVKKATVVLGTKFMVDCSLASTPNTTPGSRGKVRSSVKSILSSCFYPREADKWEVIGSPSRVVECQQYVVTYE